MKSVLNLFLALLLSFALVGSACARDVKFAVLSDVHLSTTASDAGARQLSQSVNKLQKGVDVLNSLNVDFVVFAGDNIDNPSKEDLVLFAKIARKIKKPVYVAIGNHDVAEVTGLDKKEYFRLLNKFSHNRVRKVPCVKRPAPGSGLVFIFMDGVNQFIPGSRGYFRDKDTIWLDKKLRKYKNNHVVIIQHYPIREPYFRRTHMTYKPEEYLEVLERHDNVIAVISGHFHSRNIFIDEKEVYHISVPAFVEGGGFVEINIEKAQGNRGKRPIVKIKAHDIN
jgi:DNA repair exonuclease SbcCD nuclease subunit